LEWVEDLEKALQMNPGPKVFLAHSIGCLLAAEWARNRRDPGVAGAFLVAPPDPRGPNYPRDAGGFGSPFEVVLPFPSFVAASRNDPYSSFDYSRRLAEQWKSRFLDAGEKGHIHLKSNLGFWNEGWEWFGEFLAAIGYPPAAGN
jgi:predicted alpha/beta hydrolase family esterase